ncbi:MAG: flagellar basal body rod protein FlgB [Pseudomonadota bacterium]
MEGRLERTLGIHDDALRLRAQRANVIASNIANADVPGYKARDVDFKAALSAATQRSTAALKMVGTDDQHMGVSHDVLDTDPLYRVPNQPTLDGNTVDSQTENALFAQNTLQYQASLQFLSSKFRSLRFAIKGQ